MGVGWRAGEGGGEGEEGGEREREKGEGRAERRGGECGSHQSQQAAPEQDGRGSVQRVQQPHPAGGQRGAGSAGGTRTSEMQPRLPLPAPPAERWAGTLGGRAAPGSDPGTAFLTA